MGYVVGHASQVLMHTCKFVVKAKARNRVRLTKHKTVHVWVEGTIQDTIGFKKYRGKGLVYTEGAPIARDTPIRYNPLVDDGFSDTHKQYYSGADAVHLGPCCNIQAGGLTVE